MKVLHVLDHSLPEVDGYAVRSSNIARWQSDVGLDPVVVTSAAHRGGDARKEAHDGISYYRSLPKPDWRLPFAREWRRVRDLTARIKFIAGEERVDLIHAHSPCLWGEAASRAARALRLPFVYEVRGFWEDAAVDRGKTTSQSLRYRLSQALETRVARAADAVVVIANPLGDDLVARGVEPGKIAHVPNGVDTDRFRPRPADAALQNQLTLRDSFVIGFVGSLFVWEGVEDLVKAARGIVDGLPSATVLIVGRGEQLTTARALVEQARMGDRVRLVGAVPHNQVVDYYSVMDLVVYPRKSTRNTELVTPLKPLEAMSMGKAVLGSDVGGIRELVPDNAGRFFRAGDVKDLAAKCVDLGLAGETRLRLGQMARQHVTRRHQWKSLAHKYVDLYSSFGSAARIAGNVVQLNAVGKLASRLEAREHV